MAFSLSTIVMAKGENPIKKNSKDIVKDSTEIKVEQKFEVQFEEGHVYVTLNGDFDLYASISIADHNGTDLDFQFVRNTKDKFDFETSNLTKGSYFVILTTKDEIRMKRFHIM